MKRVIVVGFLFLGVLFFSFPTFGQEIPIGFFAPLTGFAASDGRAAKNGVELGVKDVNDAGGIKGRKVKLVVYDDRHDSKEAVAIANKLAEKDRVVAVVSGSYSMPTRVTAPIFQKAKIPMVAGYAVHPDITRAGNYIFRNGCLGEVEGAAAADVAIKMLKGKRNAVLTMDNDFGRELSRAFVARAEKLGTQIVSHQIYKLGEKDFTPFLTKAKESNPDVIFTSGYYNEAALICRQAKALGITAQILGEEGFDSPKFLEIAGDAAEGVVFVSLLNRDDQRPVVQNFLKNYEKMYGMETEMCATTSYDAFVIVAKAIEKGGPKPRAIRQAIATMKDIPDLLGKVKEFNELGESKKPVQVQIVKGGRFRFYAEVTDPEVITPPNK